MPKLASIVIADRLIEIWRLRFAGQITFLVFHWYVVDFQHKTTKAFFAESRPPFTAGEKLSNNPGSLFSAIELGSFQIITILLGPLWITQAQVPALSDRSM